MALELQSISVEGGCASMLAAAIAGVLIVFALFLSMLGQSPKDDAEWNPDTEV
jgi:hypothetical protein